MIFLENPSNTSKIINNPESKVLNVVVRNLFWLSCIYM